jgi:hypothetical protein
MLDTTVSVDKTMGFENEKILLAGVAGLCVLEKIFSMASTMFFANEKIFSRIATMVPAAEKIFWVTLTMVGVYRQFNDE